MYHPPVSKEKYYYHAAKRFMMDAQLLRCRAAIHVEDKDDIVFWSNIFKHFRPNDRFHFIAGSRNERGHETRGVTQCLKYVKYLNPKFFICMTVTIAICCKNKGSMSSITFSRPIPTLSKTIIAMTKV